jgi:hypothetical protein
VAFKIIVSDTVAVAVKGHIPDEKGALQAFSFSLVCRRLKSDALAQAAGEKTAVEFVRDVVIDWSGVTDATDTPLPFTGPALDELLNIPGMAGVIGAAYMQTCGARGKEKN